ncbi:MULTISPECIES: hypothetical protein [Fructobacillus]|uniref:Uncharacterized protein n=1 Tax=Fructobacillus tropaeoli TaxID=709323 RepID=A0ABN9Z1I2_9LACO|nr:unnamed protein product [Fructobacillus sp. LMG 32999]CAK1254513.1 unnamed protein product [Fructobacillus tropaeoli]
MQSFLAIKSDLKTKQRNNKKWRFILYILSIYMSIRIIHLLYLVRALQSSPIIDTTLTLHVYLLLLLILMTDVFVFFIFRFFHRIDWITKTENEIIDITTNTQVDEWLSRNKELIANVIFSPPLPPKKRPNYPWGVINQDDYYQIIFIDFSKKNSLVILTIQKSEINQYDEEKTIKNLIHTIQKRAKKTEKPIFKQFYSSVRFFSTISSQKTSQ